MNATAVRPKICPTCGTRFAAEALFCPDDGTPLSSAGSVGEARVSEAPDPYLGREISGHIEIRQLAGIGAMGRVYRAFQRGIERDVAVKILHRELSANPQLVARFHREAKVASRLAHPNVVQVHLAGQLPDGALYIAMEYLDGMSLQSALAAAGGYMPLTRALHVALQICDAAGEAHALGVVHRDLKPENVMLVRRGDDPDYVKVLDFGIARLNWGDQSMATAAGLIFGTARYISPEGAQGETVGPAGDVYAIATLLYQMLAGRTPFEGDQAVALLVQQIHDAAPQLRSIPRAANVPDAIAGVVMRNLAKKAGDRAPDARVLGRLLIDAAKASGLSPEELVPRSALLGSKPGPLHLPPVLRTKQLELSADVASRLGPGSAAPNAPAAAPVPVGTVRMEASASRTGLARDAPPRHVTAIVPPPSRGARDASPAPAPGAPTTKWAPPADLAERLAPRPKTPTVPVVEPRKRVDSNVERTLDGDDLQPSVTPPPPPPPAAELAPPRNEIGVTVDIPAPPAAPAPAARAPVRTEFGEPAYQGPAPPPAAAAPASRPSSPSAPGVVAKPASNVDSTLSDGENELSPRRARSRAAVVIFFCFAFGVIATAAVLYRMGWLGPSTQANTLDAQVSRASEAMRHKRWDAPPGDNVRDITDDGLSRWPRDPRLLDIRERAADELVKEAVGRKFDGDAAEALHLARLANQLDPTDTTAQHLVEDYQQTDKLPEAIPPMTLPEAGALPSHASGARPPTSSREAPTAKVTIDAAPVRPRVGQPVAFSARVTNGAGGAPKTIEDVHFKLNGPGLSPDTRLSPVADEPGTYRAAFTFFEAGKYELTFEARVDGVLIRTVRPVVTGDEAPAPPGSPSLPPSPSGKWL